MFTGIVEETGVVLAISPGQKSVRLTVEARLCGRGLKIGDSLSVNGCCLTVVGLQRAGGRVAVRFDLLRATWNGTNLSSTRPGRLVNLERSLKVDGRLDGHFVTGHIDGTGRIVRWERVGQDWVLDVATSAAIRRYLVAKGSIAVDGVSLTVAAVTTSGFRVWIIPHTYKVTTLRERKVGSHVNLEADLLGKYVERFIRSTRKRRRRSGTRLKQGGPLTGPRSRARGVR